MRRSQIILLTVFAAGALITGIGTGAALGEYSSMEYEGIVTMGEENWVTDTITCRWEPQKGESLLVNLYNYPPQWNVELVEDENVPMGELECEFTYNGELYKPHASVESIMEGEMEERTSPRETKPSGYLEMWISYQGDEFATLMEYKDDMLRRLKERKLASYELATVKDVKIRMNPGMADYLEINE